MPRPARAAGAPTARAIERVGALLRAAERPVIMAGTDLYWGHGEDALRELVRGARHPGVPQRPRARLPAGRPPQLLRARAQRRAQGRRRRARDRRADGLPPRLRRQLRRGHADRPDRPRRARAATPRARSPAELYGGSAATLAALRRRARGGGAPTAPRVARAACAGPRTEKRAAEREQLNDDRAPLHPMRVYKELARCSTATRS